MSNPEIELLNDLRSQDSAIQELTYDTSLNTTDKQDSDASFLRCIDSPDISPLVLLADFEDLEIDRPSDSSLIAKVSELEAKLKAIEELKAAEDAEKARKKKQKAELKRAAEEAQSQNEEAKRESDERPFSEEHVIQI